MTTFKDIAHHYLASQINVQLQHVTPGLESQHGYFIGHSITFTDNAYIWLQQGRIKAKPYLRPLSSFSLKDWKSIAAYLLNAEESDLLINNTWEKHLWLACEDFESRFGTKKFIEKIMEAEEDDPPNVLSLDIPTMQLAHGTDISFRYFPEGELQARFFNELIRLGFDVFNLIATDAAMPVAPTVAKAKNTTEL